MQVASFSEFRKHLKDRLDSVTNNHDLLIVHRQGGKSVVVMSMEDYNSMEETRYLLSTKANKASLDRALEQFRNNEGQVQQLTEII